MNLEARDIITIMSVLVTLLGMFLLNRNTKNATSINAQNLDLARIGRLRSELEATENKLIATEARLVGANQQVDELVEKLTEANDRAITYARLQAEMLNYARMPGMDMDTWLRRFDPDGSHEIGARVGR